jgi:hypothetical protein
MCNLQRICIQFKFEILQCICSIRIHSFLAFKNPAHSELAKGQKMVGHITIFTTNLLNLKNTYPPLKNKMLC